MSFKMSFQGMEHSLSIENYARERIIEKIEKLFKHDENDMPHGVEIHLKSFPAHAHQEITMTLKNKDLLLTVCHEATDTYIAIDEAISKIVNLVKKEKEKLRDLHRSKKDY